ncbi:MAG: SprB repeat-containing protein [Lewinellaceae bacterium]|nr:SprB repeat-containing protein [Lewinellaceae bacterium]
MVGIPATCGLSNGGADATVSGGAPPYTYHWSNNATTQDLSNIPPGTYPVTVSGFFGCSATATVNVANNIALNISGTPTGNNSCIAANGAVNILLHRRAYTYLWSNAAATQNISGIAAGHLYRDSHRRCQLQPRQRLLLQTIRPTRISRRLQRPISARRLLAPSTSP